MLHYIGKLAAVLLVCALSAAIAIYYTDDYVNAVNDKQKSISDAILEAQLQAALKEAEDVAKAELEEKSVTIATAVLETKPPVTTITETETTTETTTVSETTVPETTTISETEVTTTVEIPERVTDYKVGGLLPKDRTSVKIKTIFTLTADEQKYFSEYLVEHYFLNGFTYANMETDPDYKAKKQIAAEMQAYVSNSLNIVTKTLDMSDVTKLLTADYNASMKEIETLSNEFTEKYADAAKYGDDYIKIYSNSIAYFDRLIVALRNFQKAADDYKNAANPLLAIGLLTSSIDEVLMPEILAVLESSFDIIEITQPIYLDGTTGVWLLTRDEVRDIIINPGLIF